MKNPIFCDYCGKEIEEGQEHEVMTENFENTGSYQCNECWEEEMLSYIDDDDINW